MFNVQSNPVITRGGGGGGGGGSVDGSPINQVEFRETVRAYFPQGQSKLSVIMRRLYK